MIFHVLNKADVYMYRVYKKKLMPLKSKLDVGAVYTIRRLARLTGLTSFFHIPCSSF